MHIDTTARSSGTRTDVPDMNRYGRIALSAVVMRQLTHSVDTDHITKNTVTPSAVAMLLSQYGVITQQTQVSNFIIIFYLFIKKLHENHMTK